MSTSETLFATRAELTALSFDDKLTKLLIEQGVRMKMNKIDALTEGATQNLEPEE